MGISTGQSLLLATLKKLDRWSSVERVCDLGAQFPAEEELIDLFAAFGKSPLPTGYSTTEFYRHLGAKHYTSIDFNGREGALPFDLNNSLRDVYGYDEQFDLVTNFGTANVVFNQFEIFRNIHRLCKPGGYMIHTFPTQGWANKWFFRHDQRFVQDLAAANGYELLFLEPFFRLRSHSRKPASAIMEKLMMLSAFVRDQIEKFGSLEGDAPPIDLLVQRELGRRQDIRELLGAVAQEDALFNVSLACILRKNSDNEFAVPILEMYQNQNIS